MYVQGELKFEGIGYDLRISSESFVRRRTLWGVGAEVLTYRNGEWDPIVRDQKREEGRRLDDLVQYSSD